MRYLIKIIQLYHKYLFLHTKDWQNRSKLIEADFERRLDMLASTDKHFMVRHTLVNCRIGVKTKLILADDDNEDVIRSLISKSIDDSSKKVLQKIKDRNLPYFESALNRAVEIDKARHGRFANNPTI